MKNSNKNLEEQSTELIGFAFTVSEDTLNASLFNFLLQSKEVPPAVAAKAKIKAIEKEKIIAIVRGVEKDKLIPLAKALYNGGIRLIEITYSADKSVSDGETAENIKIENERIVKYRKRKKEIIRGYKRSRTIKQKMKSDE